MENLSQAHAFLKEDVMPLNSKIIIKMRHDLIANKLDDESIFTKCLIEKIKKISVGKKVKNEIENVVDFSSRNSIMNYFKKKLKILEVKPLDDNTDVACVLFETEIYYANKSQIIEDLDEVERLVLKSFFLEVEIK